MKLQPVGAIALSLGTAAVFSALNTTQSVAASRHGQAHVIATEIATATTTPDATATATATGGATATPRPTRTPRAAGTPCPTPVPGSTPARPAHTPGAGDIRLLEGALARTLTDTEVAAITAAATTRDTAVTTAITSFETQIAAIFNLTPAQLQTKINSVRPRRNSDLASVLALALGRALTSDETIALNGALATRDAAITAATDAYRASVAAAVALSVADLDAKVQAYLAANTGGGHGPGGGGGHRG